MNIKLKDVVRRASIGVGRLVKEAQEGFTEGIEAKRQEEKIEKKVKEISPPTQ